MLGELWTSMPSSWIEGSMHSSARSAISIASSCVTGPPRRITNSSPPMRAVVSIARTAWLRRCATTRSRSSPARCPRESLMSLNRSRSTIMTANSCACPLRLGDGLGNAVVEQQPVRKPGERIVGGQMPQLAVGRLEPLGAVGDDQLEALDVALERTGVLPLAAERARALQDLDRLEGLLDHDELVGVPEPREELQPVVVGVGGADDDLYVRIDLPQVLDGLQPIPARGHPHVHESDRVGRSEEHTSELQSLT